MLVRLAVNRMGCFQENCEEGGLAWIIPPELLCGCLYPAVLGHEADAPRGGTAPGGLSTPARRKHADTGRLPAMRLLGLLGLWLTLGASACASSVVLSGRIVDGGGAALSGVHVVIAGPIAAGQLVARTDAAGRFSFRALSPGGYRLEAVYEGFFPVRQEIQLGEGGAELELVLSRQKVSQAVDVVASILNVDPQQTARSRTLTPAQIANVPFAPSWDFRRSLAILPGVATDARGRLHVNGGGSDQVEYLLDGFNLTSPVSGTLENNFGVDAVRAADVRSSRYSAEYGKGSAGTISVTTQTGGDRFRHHVTDFIPSFDNRGGSGWHAKDWAPRFTLSGPFIRSKLWFLNSFDAKYDLDVISGLPESADRTSNWRWNDLFRLQAQVGPSHLLGFSFLHNTGKAQFFGLDLITPLEATRNIVSNNNFFSVKDQRYWNGVLTEVGFAINSLRLSKNPLGDQPYVVEPTMKHGNFFLRQQSEVQRWQWVAGFMPRPLYRGGRHDVRFGVDGNRILNTQLNQRRSFQTLRENHWPWRVTTFAGNPRYSLNNMEWSGYVQDRWSPRDRLLVELGLRHDRDQVIGRMLWSPRLAVTVVPWAGKDVKVSGGVGVVYDATNLSVVARSLDQRQFDTFLNPDGSLSWGPAETVFQADWHALRQPRVLNWSMGWEQVLPRRLSLRAAFLQKRGSNGFTFRNLLPKQISSLYAVYQLVNTRRDDYRALELTLNHVTQWLHWSASYVRSSARSNAVLDYTIENPVFAGQGPGPLDWDMPNRAVANGWIPFRKIYTFSGLLEWHTGTPFCVLNGTQELVGAANRMRFPNYFTLNLHAEREFATGRYRWTLRVGFNNVTGHDNLSMVNNNVASPKFGTFAGKELRGVVFRIRYLGRKSL